MKRNKIISYFLVGLLTLSTVVFLIKTDRKNDAEIRKCRDMLILSQKNFYQLTKDNFFKQKEIGAFDSLIRTKFNIQSDELVLIFILKTPICMSCFEGFYENIIIKNNKTFILTDELGRIALNFWIKNNKMHKDILIVNEESLQNFKSYNLAICKDGNNLLVSMDKDYPTTFLSNIIKVCNQQ